MRANIAVAGVLLLASAGVVCAGPTVSFMGQSAAWGPTSNGGPFEFAPTGFGFNPGVGKNGAGPANFISFCVERSETISGGSYDVTFDTAAIGGGMGGGNPDPLDFRTAYLYTTFMAGTLGSVVPAFTYGTFGSSPTSAVVASGDALQSVIWGIETELGATWTPAAGLETSLYNAAVAAVAGSWGNTIGNVRIMNLTVAGGGLRQSQLVIIPLPAEAGMAAWGMAALFGARIVRRRRA